MVIIERQVYADATRSLVESTTDAVELMVASLRRPDFREGVSSFLQKRPPAFESVEGA